MISKDTAWKVGTRFDQFHPRFSIIRYHDFHDIESKKNVRIIEHSQPG
jgi:hypothetical protein